MSTTSPTLVLPYPSPFESAAVLCMDGVGEWATTSAWLGEGSSLAAVGNQLPPFLRPALFGLHLLLRFQGQFRRIQIDGLALYGEPKYVDQIKDHLIDIKPDGTYRLDLSYFKFHRGFHDGPQVPQVVPQAAKERGTELTQFHMDLAASIQVVTEEIVVKLARSLQEETGARNLCLSGGVALNCVANGKLLREGIFDHVWIQPASGDAGSALGPLWWHGISISISPARCRAVMA